MKRNLFNLSFLLVLFFVNTSAVVAQIGIGGSNWQFSNPKPFGFWGSQLSYADDNNVLVVGDAGGIAKSTDGGGTWMYRTYVTINSFGDKEQPTLNDVQFVNGSVAYAVGSMGTVIKSTDGGINWTPLNNPFAADKMEIHTLYFNHPDTGFIGGEPDMLTGQATLYRTVDGGATWQSFHQFPASDPSWLGSAILKIRFKHSNLGYIIGQGAMIHKYDNGNWTQYRLTDTTEYYNLNPFDTLLSDNFNGGFDTIVTNYSDNIWGLKSQSYRSLAILSDSIILIGSQNNGGLIRINTSTPTGTFYLANNSSALHPKYAPIGSSQLYNFVNKDANTIWGTTENGDLLTSLNGGFNFTRHPIYPTNSTAYGLDIWGIALSPGGRLGICGARGIIADSIAGNWRRPYNLVKGQRGSGIEAMHFFDANHGVAAGGVGLFQRTSNSGQTWEDITSGSFQDWEYYTGVKCLSKDTIIASASNGGFYKSVDRGSTFDLLFAEPKDGQILSMDFINADTGWMVANQRLPDTVNFEDTSHSVIYYTYDGGNTWDTSEISLPYQTGWNVNMLNVVRFYNANLGFVGDSKGILYKSTNAGVNWTKLTNLPAETDDKPFYSIDIADANTIYATGEGFIIRSTDAGSSWTLINNGLPGGWTRYNTVLAYDVAMVLVFSGNKVYSTKNGGASWDEYFAPIRDMLYAAAFAPLANCTSGICKKAFVGGGFGGNIMKLDADVVLPVKLGTLTGSATTEGNQLFWTAFAQEDVKQFEIERSIDGVRFGKIGDNVLPSTFARQSYQWLDATATESRNYYRVKAVERNGAIYYTNIVVINGKKAVKWNYQIAHQNLVLNNVKVAPGMVNASIINQAGQMVTSKTWNHAGGAFNQLVQLPATAKGIYMLRINYSGQSETYKIFIQQ